MTKKRIIVIVNSGVVDIDETTIPEGVEVEVIDYDVQNCPISDLDEDAFGRKYLREIWTRKE